ncbi:MAG: glycosyltransferase [Burkholderiales bacterium]|nr:glycosyltransferase [Burkholderiales bacterium]
MSQKKMKLIKIIYVTGALDIGGTETHILNLVPELSKIGFKPYIFSINGRGVLADELEARGIKVFTTWGARWIRPLPSVLRVLFVVPLAFLSLTKLIFCFRPKIIHMFLPAAYVIGGFAAMIGAVPVRIMSRRSRNFYQARHSFAASLERILHRQMTVLLGNSLKVVEDLQNECAQRNKIRLIYNGIHLPDIRNAESNLLLRRNLGIDCNTLVFTMTANLIAYKGHRDLIEAFKLIKGKLGGNWCLICIGDDRGVPKDLKKLSCDVGVDKHVLWLGSRRDVIKILAASDIGVLSSHEEGFSNAVLEYMGAGLPSVVTDVGGNAEAVLHEKCGLVVSARDPASLGRALLRLSKDSMLRATMGVAARNRIKKYFTLEHSVENYANLYHDLLGKNL